MPDWINHLYSRQVAIVVTLALLLLMVYQSLQTFQWYRSITSTQPSAMMALQPVVQQPKQKINYAIFGVYQERRLDNLPSSQMDIQLIGLYVAKDRKHSQVILSIAGSEEKVYHEGDSLPGGVTIYKINPNQVILKRGAELETIRLEQTPIQFNSSPKQLDLPAF